MFDNINFIDLVALTRINSDSTVEKFGGLINSSFFDASNILGGLKQKGLVDFITQFPGQSAITVTEQGKQLIEEAQKKASEEFDALDLSIASHLSKGNRALTDLTTAVNVAPKDLALHLFKMSSQQFIAYELRNGNMGISLTEKGFLKVNEGMLPHAQQAAALQQGSAPQQGAPSQPPAQPKPQTGPMAPEDAKALEAKIMQTKKMRVLAVIVICIIIAVVAGYLYIAG